MTTSPITTTTTMALHDSPTVSASSPSHLVYKGKAAHRSWPQLPQELVRHIATFYLWDLSATNYCPQVWESPEAWHHRMVYSALRDARDMERFMSICPPWGLAVEHHLFWQQAVALIDPLDTLINFAYIRQAPNNNSSVVAPPIRLSPYQHFRNISNCSCHVCRINSPYTNLGLGIAKRPASAMFLGSIPVCREHRKNTFCGLCLREAPAIDDEHALVSCVENEDEDSWPGVDATCRSCRSEWLWRRVCNSPRDREAVGGSKWNSADWETRQTVEGFIDLGEGTIADVITLANEKQWLRKNTKLPDMLSQAVASSRYNIERGEYETDDELSEDDELDDEDPELMQFTEDNGGIKALAISDWARNRILDGYWFSPADQWYGHTVANQPTVVPAVHPCPWNKDATFTGADGGSSDEADGDSDVPIGHPRPATIRAEVPPSFQLCEQAYVAYQKQMRIILLPAMNNIVRKIVIECSVDGVDPAMKASRMELEDVLAELRTEAIWYNGIDWLERRRNERKDEGERMRKDEGERLHRQEGSDDSSTSSKSDESATSPVLSTSTFQTTPSPPPVEDKSEPITPVRLTLPVAPVLDSPKLLHPIPWIPVTVAHMPNYSLESFRTVWREACAPLYHCRCKICERSMAMANAAAGTEPSDRVVPSQTPAPTQTAALVALESPVEIRLEEISDGEGEEEIDDDDDDLAEITSQRPDARPRKRSCDELDPDEDAEGELDHEYEEDARRERELALRGETPPKRVLRGETPPKRARHTGPASPCAASATASPRMRKRGSEELEGEEQEVLGKRARIAGEEEVESPPTSIAGTGETDSAGDVDADAEDDADLEAVPIRSAGRKGRVGQVPWPAAVSETDLEGLYVLEGEGET